MRNKNIFVRGITTPAVIAIVIVVAALAGGYYLLRDGEIDLSDGVDTSNWETMRSEAYNFSVQHPPEWNTASFPDDEIQPIFNVFKPGTLQSNPPLIHHNAGTHVSVFPAGVPTEGVAGEQATSTVADWPGVADARDFLLEDGTAWATIVRFENMPESWTESGFLWAQVGIENLETQCLRDGEQVSEEACDPLFGDTIIRSGSINEDDREIQLAMIESFAFSTTTGTTTNTNGTVGTTTATSTEE